MSTQATVIGSYDAVRRSRDAQDQRSRSADGEGDNLMKGRTFIPRMSAESRKLLIEAMQRAKKKRQERISSREKAKIDERTRPSLIAAEEETKDLMSQMSSLSQGRELAQPSEMSRYRQKEINPGTTLDQENRDATLRGILEEVGVSEGWLNDQLSKDDAWFSHLSGEPMKERLTALRDRIKQGGSKHPTDVGIASMTDDDISAYAQRIEDNIPYNERQAYNDSKRKYRHREVQRTDNRVREEKENEVLSADEQDLSDAKSRQRRSSRAVSPEIGLMNAMSQLPGGTIQGAVEQGISPALAALGRLARGGKIPQYKKRTIKYRR
jgi:hypothetical protein